MNYEKELQAIGHKIKKARGKKSYYSINQMTRVTPTSLKNLEENGACSVSTLLRVCNSLGLRIIIE